jgi:hypothetical protein
LDPAWNRTAQDRFGSLGFSKAKHDAMKSTSRTTARIRARERLFLISTSRWHRHEDGAYHPTVA